MKTKLPNNSLFKIKKNKKISTKYSGFKQKDNFISKNKKHFSLEERENIVIKGQSNDISVMEICKKEGITPSVFYKWTQEFLEGTSKNKLDSQPVKNDFSNDERYRIVLEGNNGTYSIAEICKKENINHDEFLQWSDEFLQIRKKRQNREKIFDRHTTKVKELIENLVGKEILEYFESFIDVTSKQTIVIRDHHQCSKDKTFKNKSNLVCLSKINDIRNINKHFELINSKLPQGGVFIGCLETLTARRERINKNGIPILNDLYLV